MKKGIALIVFGFVLFAAVSLFANAKILTAHKTYKGFRTITKCADCHNPATKLEKKKGTNYKPLLKTASCAGQGCHK